MTASGEFTVGDLRIDSAARRAFRGTREIELSKTEFDLLELLVRNKGIVLDHSTIYDRIWHYDFGPDSKNLAVYIGYLRRKTEARRRTADRPHRARRRVHGATRRRMNLRWKIALALAVVALMATTAVGIISYRSTSERLVDEVDRSIATAAAQLAGRPRP